MPDGSDERLRQKKRWKAETQRRRDRLIEVLGLDITIVQDCELVPDMIKDLAKKALSMSKTLC